jgi:translation initiation factor IF-1
MPERPSIIGIATVAAERIADRLYEVELPNGHRAMGVIPKLGPFSGSDWQNRKVRVAFSPYDMSRCRIMAWLDDDASPP